MAYPASLDSFTTKVDAVDTYLAAHVNSLQTAVVAVETELGTDPAGTVTDLKTRLSKSISGGGFLNFLASSILTIAAGAITATQNWHRVDTEGAGATDDLDTITAGADGWILLIRPADSARNVVVKHGVGNIVCAGGQDITLDLTSDLCLMVYDGVITKWIAMGITGAGLLNGTNSWSGPQTWGAAEVHKFTSVNAATTLDSTHHTVSVDASGGAITITLPAVSGLAGREYVVIKADSSANAVTLDGNGAETINGAATLALATQYTKTRIVCDGTGWLVIG